jgi:competence protein ComEC
VKRPLVWVSAGWIAGVFAARGWNAFFFYGCAAVLVALAGGWIVYHYRKGRVVLFLLLGLFAGAFRYAWDVANNVSHLPRQFLNSPQVAIGKVVSLPDIEGDQLTFEMMVFDVKTDRGWRRVIPERVAVRRKLHSYDEWEEARQLKRLSTIRIRLTFSKPPRPRNPGAFDYGAYLYRRHIHLIGQSDSPERIKVLASVPHHPLVLIDRGRAWLDQRIEKLYGRDQSGYLRGLLLGEQSAVPDSLETQYATLGIIHLLSVSGLHVAVVIGCFYFLLTRLGLTREKSALAILLCLPVYAVLTGLGPPVIRAVIMAGFSLLAIVLKKFRDTLSFLAVSFLVQLGWNPFQIEEAGFQLSYLVTAALVVGTEPVAGRIPVPSRSLRQFLAANLIAELVSFPVLIFHFHEFSLLSWLANLLFVPLISSLILPLSLGSLLLAFVPGPLASWLACLTSQLLELVHQGVRWMLQWTWAFPSWAGPSALWLALYCFTVISLAVVWMKPFVPQWKRIGVVLLLFSLVAFAYGKRNGEGAENRIAFLDVGQGDAAVVETQTGKTILIDSGGFSSRGNRFGSGSRRFDAGENVIIPYLKYRGIKQIDLFILTHGDADHIGGAKAVVQRFPVKMVIRGPLPPKSALELDLLREMRERKIPIRIARPGLRWQFSPGVFLTFLHPATANRSANDESVVFLLSIGRFQTLMTGDISSEAEKRILAGWRLPHVQVLKVAHHGSRTSTGAEWLDAVAPRYAVISVGRHNPFGHPSPLVLQRLRARHAVILRTDQLGAIIFHVEKQKIRVESTSP